MSDGVHLGHVPVGVFIRASGCVFVRLGAPSCVSVRLRASPCVSVRPISPNCGKRGFLYALKPRHSVKYARLKKT
jgi:hypothetical protein